MSIARCVGATSISIAAPFASSSHSSRRRPACASRRAENEIWSSLYDASGLSHQRAARALAGTRHWPKHANRSCIPGVGRSASHAQHTQPRMVARHRCYWRPANKPARPHASSLIAAGVDILMVSRRLGHANPTITLGVYGHLYGNTDDRAAQAIDAMLSRTRTE